MVKVLMTDTQMDTVSLVNKLKIAACDEEEKQDDGLDDVYAQFVIGTLMPLLKNERNDKDEFADLLIKMINLVHPDVKERLVDAIIRKMSKLPLNMSAKVWRDLVRNSTAIGISLYLKKEAVMNELVRLYEEFCERKEFNGLFWETFVDYFDLTKDCEFHQYYTDKLVSFAYKVLQMENIPHKPALTAFKHIHADAGDANIDTEKITLALLQAILSCSTDLNEHKSLFKTLIKTKLANDASDDFIKNILSRVYNCNIGNQASNVCWLVTE
jgi:hypothetical protein